MPEADGSCLQLIHHTCHSRAPFPRHIHEISPHGCEALAAVLQRDRSLHTSNELSAGQAVQAEKTEDSQEKSYGLDRRSLESLLKKALELKHFLCIFISVSPPHVSFSVLHKLIYFELLCFHPSPAYNAEVQDFSQFICVGKCRKINYLILCFVKSPPTFPQMQVSSICFNLDLNNLRNLNCFLSVTITKIATFPCKLDRIIFSHI